MNKFLDIKPNSNPFFVEKAWGGETWIHNSEKYCGKILHFNPNASFSTHFHLLKKESWACISGPFILSLVDLTNATTKDYTFNTGDVIDIPPLLPHKLQYVGQTTGLILEVSTQHFDEDSYRIAPGDSQK